MFARSTLSICFLTTLLSRANAFTLDARPQPRSTYPFDHIIAFGDEFSDNGNGSYAHGISGSPLTVYGFGTWTNGPVAVSYLSNLLSVYLRDYAFGGCCGGGSFGATLDTTYTPSPAKSPSLVTQIANYTTGELPNIGRALEFIWVGQNDLSEHTDAFWLGDPKNDQFASNFSSRIADSVDTLLKAGAPYVMVANLHPKHLSPLAHTFLCGTSSKCISTWGEIIVNANVALETSMKQFGSKVIYYDVYGFMTALIENATEKGFTKALTSFCDGDGDANWDSCMEHGQGGDYLWMNWEQPTTRVHQLIAADMKSAVDKHFGL